MHITWYFWGPPYTVANVGFSYLHLSNCWLILIFFIAIELLLPFFIKILYLCTSCDLFQEPWVEDSHIWRRFLKCTCRCGSTGVSGRSKSHHESGHLRDTILHSQRSKHHNSFNLSLHFIYWWLKSFVDDKILLFFMFSAILVI